MSKHRQRKIKERLDEKMRKSKICKYLLLLLMLCVCIGSVMGCSTKGQTTDTFTVGFDAEFPPYGYKDENGEYVGFDLDLAQEVCDRNGWTLVKKAIDWDSKDMELNSGTIDCIWNGCTINGREDKYTWSTPYIDNSQVVIVKSSSDIKILEDLKGKIVAVQTASSALEAFTSEGAEQENIELANSFKDLQQVSDYNSAFMNLESGAIDAICLDIGVANYELEKRGSEFLMLDEHVSSEQYGIGFKLGNTELRDDVQKTLFEMKEDGTFDKIAEEWGLADSACLDVNDKTDDSNLENSSEENSNDGTIKDIALELSTGMLATLTIFVCTLLFSMPLGLLLTFIRMSRFRVVQWIAKIYISIMRGTPLMLQLLVVYFGPYYVFRMDLSSSYRLYAVIIGFSLNYAAYFAEIFRSGIQSIPQGQREAAHVLGYSKSQVFGKIIFPQMVKRVMPPVTNEVITLVKDTSLAYVLSYTEMFMIAKEISARQANIIPIFVAGVFYYIFNLVIAAIMSRIEKKLEYYR